MTRTIHSVKAIVKAYEKSKGQKRRPGRPSKYEDNPEAIHEMVLFCAAQGMSKTETAVAIGVRYGTLLDWEEKYPEFSNTIKEAQDLCRAWWLNKGRTSLHRDDFNATLWMMNMSNRFGWSRKVDSKVDSKQTIEGVVDHKHTHTHTHNLDMNKLNREEAENLRDIIDKATKEATEAGRN